MNHPHDQSARDRFVEELDRNFSVIASAGSGKTRGITDRIVALARDERALSWLPSLVVVTYTNRAAAEMQQRARQSILEAGVSSRVLAAFNRAFFGTIHSLCLKLLRQHGHHLGLPARLDHIDEDDDDALWSEFVQRTTTIGADLGDGPRRALLRLVTGQDLMELGHRGMEEGDSTPPGEFPAFDFSAIDNFVPAGRSAETYARSQTALRRWAAAWAGDGFVGSPPKCECKPLNDVWQAALGPVLKWRQRAARHAAISIARAYREFRLSRGVMTFGDQVALAGALLQHPDAAQRIRAKHYRVILDEAQDTDPTQFNVLLEIARPPGATGSWPDEPSAPPRPGHFCMVGDFQQSIYGARANLAHYRRVHDVLLTSGAGESLTFSVTFRLDEAGTAFVNAVFPSVLHGQHRQVSFVELRARPEAFPGQIVRFDPGPRPGDVANKDNVRRKWEADRLARWLHAAGLTKLRASSWREVAILCPRTRWLAPVRTALRSVGLEAQVQSERSIRGDSPACAWFTALTVALAEPRNGYEIVGVLREVFGISDRELAAFVEEHGDRFHLNVPHRQGSTVAAVLDQLEELRQRMQTMPLFSALQEMVKTTQLRDRLRSLPANQFEDLDLELDELLTQAASAEIGEATLASFAADLRNHFSNARAVRGVAPDAVQIISGYKAKGSEWDAVIVPFFAHSVTVQKPPFPRLLRDPRAEATVAALDGSDLDADLKSAIDQHDEQELERLLYVALTRARHTLVIVDDRSLFATKSGLPSKSQAKLLRCASGDTNAAAFDGLPDALTPCDRTAAAMAGKTAPHLREEVLPLVETPSGLLEQSRERAARFLKRNPSALAERALAENDPLAYADTLRNSKDLPNAGKLYGTWWHGFVENLNWDGTPEQWDEGFQEHVGTSPNAGRSQQEWKALRKELTKDSVLGRLLTTPGVVAHAEMPFLWAMDQRECFDGIIDLALLHPEGHWVILDWKTNRVPGGGLEALREHYLPQLSAYWKAATEMLHAPVTAGLYSTTEGQWIPYDPTELAAAWEKLRGDSAALTRALDEDGER
ncbi:MAG TPA: UvrD-helicase domain-containing protein [Chthoniobacter sp.]